VPGAGEVNLDEMEQGAGPQCRAVLQALPEWFGIPESVERYVAAADCSPTIVASIRGATVGILTLVRHSPYAAEVYVMAVLREHHREGIGRRMLERAEGMLAKDGVEFLQVKTLSSRRHDEGYARTRAFYEACGFRPLEEMPDLWGPENPALQMVKVVADRR
jgi:GNAT superfamily N-acetyltransferase